MEMMNDKQVNNNLSYLYFLFDPGHYNTNANANAYTSKIRRRFEKYSISE